MKKLRFLILTVGMCMLFLASCQSNHNKYAYRDAGIKSLNAGDYEGAIASFDEAIKASGAMVGSFDTDVLKYRAEAECRTGDYHAAADTYDVLIKVDKERPEYLNLRCVARMNSGDLAGAVSDYDESVKLDKGKNAPGREEALLAAGAAMESQGNDTGAMALYESGEAAGQSFASLYNRMGMCKFRAKDYALASSYFSKGLSMPDAASVPELIYNQAVTHEYQGDFDEARKLMEKYVKEEKTDEKALRELEFLKSR